VLTGRRNGVTERFSVNAIFPSNEQANDFIPRLWASRKIGVLTRTLRLEGATPALEREIRETALRYGILSEYTSYLVQEPVVTVRHEIRRGFPMSAPVSGEGAVRMAAQAQQMREAKSTADLDALDRSEPSAANAKNVDSRQVAGRFFSRQNGAWVDRLASDSLRLVSIEPYSDAYFRLLDALPELKPYVQALDPVVIAGRSAKIEIASGGMQHLSSGELSRLVSEFRGR
jgi:Ca-activated chloride channel family protein